MASNLYGFWQNSQVTVTAPCSAMHTANFFDAQRTQHVGDAFAAAAAFEVHFVTAEHAHLVGAEHAHQPLLDVVFEQIPRRESRAMA